MYTEAMESCLFLADRFQNVKPYSEDMHEPLEGLGGDYFWL